VSGHLRRRQFITLLGGAAAWPLAAHAQQQAMPVIGVLGAAPALIGEKRMLGFHRGLSENGYIEGQNVAISYIQAEGQTDRLRALAMELVQRRVSVIVIPGSGTAALAAKDATTTIPIVFSTTTDPVKLGLISSLSRPGGNLTGMYYFLTDLGGKRLGVLRELMPRATAVAVLANPLNTVTETGLQNIQAAARDLGLKLHILNASNDVDVDAAFAVIARDQPDGFMQINDPFLITRRTQIILSAARHALPAIYSNREWVDAGGLMSYSTNFLEVYHQLGVYTARILKGAKPAELPVTQSTSFELVINLQSARALALQIPPTLLARADEVIECFAASS
jgi:putative ABC transport system substrate-binding protein